MKNISIIFLSLVIALFFNACGSEKEKKESEKTKVETEESEEVIAKDPELMKPYDTLAREEIRENLDIILKYASEGKVQEVAKLMAYKGSETDRHLKTNLNFNNPNEQFTAQSTTDVINIWLNQSESTEYGTFRENETQDGYTEYIQELVFMASLNTERRRFVFVRTPDKGFLLSNVQ
ncbi:MAG: hypothetical protein EA412_12095 [Chitinophagaceae bacterium]|nr:MAG: hypothetical protein EA412_12095 [Chitinophagaceae bacterium]